MTCEHLEHRLAAFVYDEVDTEVRAEIEAHLAECDACRAEAVRLRHTRQLLANWPEEENLQQPPTFLPPPARFSRARWAAAGAALGVAAALILGLLRFDSTVGPGGLRLQITLNGPSASVGPDYPSLATVADLQDSQQEVVDWVLTALEARDVEYSRRLQAAIELSTGDLERRRLADVATLTRGIETVCLTSEARFDRMGRLLAASGYGDIPSGN